MTTSTHHLTTHSTIEQTTEPTTVALEVLGRLEAAWNNADGAAFGASYAPRASFVTVRGEHIVGSAAIGAGHDAIFHSIYAGSVNQMELVCARKVADGLVLAVSLHTLDCPTGPLAGRHQAMSTSLIARSAGEGAGWVVVSTQNTLVTG